MKYKIRILAICGSTRHSSSNLNLIKAIQEITKETLEISILEGLSDIPHFNPDLDNGRPLPPVVEFQKQISESDGILICTPEYAMGVPGTLKNAIDWTVSSMDFSGKPLALITASLSGKKAHVSLLDTLLIVEAKIAAKAQMVIPFVNTKVSKEAIITDQETLTGVNKLMEALICVINNEEIDLLPSPVAY